MNVRHAIRRLGASQTFALCLASGALLPLSLAPLNLWPMALLSPTLFALLLLYRAPQTSLKHLLSNSYGFGLGLFGTGASWVYVSIHDFGYTGVPLALVLTSLFVAGLALVFSLPFLLLRHISSRPGYYLSAFAALWVLGEWFRSWLLTGFPWLYIGYSQLATPLSGWAPVSGIFGVSLAVLTTCCTFAYCYAVKFDKRSYWPLALTLTLWLSGGWLQQQSWSFNSGTPQQVAIVQANIPQEKKWLPEYRQPTLQLYRRMSQPLTDADWIIWPEAAIPVLYHQARPFLQSLNHFADTNEVSLITGIIYDDTANGHYHNSAIALGQGSGQYHKTRLVPFGEYVPLEQWLRGVISFFNLPMSMIKSGPEQQPPLNLADTRVGMAICYEIVYPDLVARQAADSEVLITLSNDAWFGHSWGPLQHLQMAQMRALETSRYIIRSTNNGVSAIINPDGELQQQGGQFTREVISGQVIPRSGNTPFTATGSIPVIALCLLIYAACCAGSRRSPIQRASNYDSV